MQTMHPDCKKVLIDSETLWARCKELGQEVSDFYRARGNSLMVIGLLKGSVPFLVDLIKHMDIDLEIDFMDVSSYSGTNSTEVKILKDVESSITGKDVLVVEDIIDTGKTLDKVVELLKSKGANDVRIITLLDKKERREVEVDVEFVGFSIPNEFVIGYGLDYNQKYRNLPYIGVIKEEAI